MPVILCVTMGMKILIFIGVAVVSVNGQFFNTEYRLDSAPLPIRRRVNNAHYEIHPSMGQEIEYSYKPARLSNQGRRHVENNLRSNLQNAQTYSNAQTFEVKPVGNDYEVNVRNHENLQNDRSSNRQQQEYNENQYRAGLTEQNNKDNIQNFRINDGKPSTNQRTNDRNKLRTNLDSTTKLPPRKDLYNTENFPTNHNVRVNENITNQQTDTTIYENTRQHDRLSKFNLDQTSQNQGDPPNYASDDIRNSETLNQLNNANVRKNNNNENKQNATRRTETSQRAIDNNGHKNQQNIDSANKNYESKPNRQNTEARKDKDTTTAQRNTDTYSFTTEPILHNTIRDRTVTGGTKSTEENELTSRTDTEEKVEDDDNRWIWMSSSNVTDSKKTSIAPTIPTVDDRAAFDGDKCPTGQVRYNDICVDKD